MKKKIVVCLIVISACSISLLLSKKKEDMYLNKETTKEETKDMAFFIKEDDNSDYTKVNNIPATGYSLNSSKSVCSNGATPSWNNGTLTLSSLSSKNTSCYLYFDKMPTQSVSDIVNGLNPTEQTSSVPNFASAATGNEGVFKTSDGMYGGDTYYWRGAVENNHVIFADLCWKMVRINGDGSIRLIYNGAPSGSGDARTCKQASDATSIAKTSQTYNASYNKSYYVGWTYGTDQRPTDNNSATASNIKTQTESWYKTNITDKGYDAQVATGKFCNDRNTKTGQGWTASGSGSTFYYAGYERLVDNKKPVTTCPTGDVYEMKVGAITADEASMAGGVYGTANSSYYLCNSQYYWTMSPSYWDSGYAGVFLVNSDGQLSWIDVNDTDLGVRPVINLRSDTVFASGGKGTASIPYITT